MKYLSLLLACLILTSTAHANSFSSADDEYVDRCTWWTRISSKVTGWAWGEILVCNTTKSCSQAYKNFVYQFSQSLLNEVNEICRDQEEALFADNS